MKMTAALLKEYIQAGGAKIPSEKVIQNGQLVNVMTSEVYPADVAIYKGKIVAVGDVTDYIGEDTQRIDAKGKYLVPGLIDGHIHIECSKMSMTSFTKAVIPFGTTSAISGLDEYISVVGMDGLKEIFEEIEQLPLRVYWGAPYKTPYTIPKSTIAYNITPEVQKEVQSWPQCFGVWETVREAVQTLDEDTMETLAIAHNNHLPIFGCAPMARGNNLNEYLSAGIRLDHESYDHEELVEKARKGMHVLIRESSVTNFLKENIRAVTEVNSAIGRRTSFCTDDVHATDILKHGHVDHLVRLAIQAGVTPMVAIQMATINSAEAYRIDDQVGSISPGRFADILFVESLEDFQVETVISKGEIVAKNNRMIVELLEPKRSPLLASKLKCDKTTPETFEYKVSIDNGTAKIRAIESHGAFVRKERFVELDVKDGKVVLDVEKDVAMVSVLERFGKNGNKSIGFVAGWGLKRGAMASSSAPDDNNLIVMGTNPEDMSLAINTLIDCGGGQVVVVDGQVISLLKLPIGGIVTDEDPDHLVAAEHSLHEAIKVLGGSVPDPMFYMSFLPITAIPDLAITDVGNVDCVTLEIFDPITELTPE
ncbi:adenine deaminase C-terminal domain-containing protein [Heyndrickxia vini]|uniref:Adenine deaminase n=1 Tax=Heyndrickxia vini TaxID=1476025 RepID=A0ABX7E0I8_9BACI|nr:adenine deaminase C-terminal domain-containing protein [Heyndrickxia vini]QQZ08741.1 adenine deaminase [Heyndrickxia vini]